MAVFDGSSATNPLRFDLFNVAGLLAGTTMTADPTTFTRGPDGVTFTTFSGSGFVYNGGLFTAGIINRIDSQAGGVLQFTIDGLAMPVARFRGFVNAGNSQGFLGAAFAGADTLTGSALSDYLQGFAGNDLLQNNAGGGVADTLDGGVGADTMEGADGDDVYIVDNAKDVILGEDAAGGLDLVRSSISFTLGAGLEHLFLTGGGALTGKGNDLANQIVGGAGANKLLGLGDNDLLEGGGGNDTLDGGTGNDTLLGGAGNDTYFIDSVGDQAIESLAGKAGGKDIVFSSVSIAALDPNIENVTLLAGAGDISVVANGLANLIVGNDGNNELTGGAGKDTVIGGAGNDAYFVDDDGDKLVESVAGPAGGKDTVVYLGTIGYTLGTNLENLELLAAAGAVFGTGNGLANEIRGNSAANTLDGKAGADILVGRGGDDTYVVDSVLDVVDEENDGGSGIDTVRSSVNFSLIANGVTVKGDVEHLTLLGKATLGTGNDLDNLIIGNAAANVLSGGGGADTLDGGGGVDTLIGGTGNDRYIIDNAKDVIQEAGGSGTDTVSSSKISVNISTLAGVEHIELLGAMALSATGNALANQITGNAGANKLFGGDGNDTLIGGDGNDTLDGGAGTDLLVGGAGNDTYIVDAGDALTPGRVSEAGGSGIDLVIASTSFSLLMLALGEVENLTLAAGSGAVVGQGSFIANALTGNENNNLLEGLDGDDTIDGGKGDDTLKGGEGNDVINVSAGNDTVLYSSELDGHDLIIGFDGNSAGGQDVFNLDGLFDGLAVPDEERASRVLIVDYGKTVDVRVDLDGSLLNGYEATVATLQTADAVTIGEDVIVFAA